MGTLLSLEGLTVEFPGDKGKLTVIEDVSFTVGSGETVCLVGESGSGKTIASKAIMRLLEFENGKLSKGHIYFKGADLAALSQQEMRVLRGRRIGMIFQEPMAAFDPVFPIGSQIAEVIVRHGQQGKRGAWKHGISLLRKVGIPEPELRMRQYPQELSGGMLQRAMIAMALACGPELLIADEPTTALDVTIQAQILHLLGELKRESGMSILLITHDLGVAAQMADRIIVMYAGAVVEEAAALQLFGQPRHPYTRELLRSITPQDKKHGGVLYSIKGSIPNLAELPPGCRFHPRCPDRGERCMTEAPPLRTIGQGQAACWRAAEAGWSRVEEAGVVQVEQMGVLQAGEAGLTFAEEAGVSHAEKDGLPLVEKAGVSHEEEQRLDGEAAGRPPQPPEQAGREADGLERTGTEPALPEQADAEPDRGEQAGCSYSRPEDAQGLKEQRPNLFVISGLTKHYSAGRSLLHPGRSRIQAVDDVSFCIKEGETFGLVGESGSGKSTLGRVLLQLEKATAGKVLFQNRDLSQLGKGELKAARRNMQIIFQDPYGSMNPRWKAGEIVAEPLDVHEDLGSREKRERVETLLEWVGLNPAVYDRHPHEFSGGQRQRLGIARAISLHPRFILADEAVSALDVSVQSQIVNLMQELQQRLGLTYLFIAHGLHIVRHISDRIGVMYLGKLVELAPSDELFRHPAHPYTRLLISSIPQADPRNRMQFGAIQGEIPSPAAPPPGCRFHTRCPMATGTCRERQPVLKSVGGEHYAACHALR
ncbi:MAG: oligopeptide/dipeptide transporter ATPase [Paenibacillaceae bacterium]|jgi:peptide/nickel transport system ATP-binding protein|nr:oligopeptide/dipeptide transporter ATPase [Paenibacillaceae bacterium]